MTGKFGSDAYFKHNVSAYVFVVVVVYTNLWICTDGNDNDDDDGVRC